jgi:hypothetical protein
VLRLFFIKDRNRVEAVFKKWHFSSSSRLARCAKPGFRILQEMSLKRTVHFLAGHFLGKNIGNI